MLEAHSHLNRLAGALGIAETKLSILKVDLEITLRHLPAGTPDLVRDDLRRLVRRLTAAQAEVGHFAEHGRMLPKTEPGRAQP